MKIVTIIARSLLGLIFTVFGLNIFLHFIPMPPPPADLARGYSRGVTAPIYVAEKNGRPYHGDKGHHGGGKDDQGDNQHGHGPKPGHGHGKPNQH